MLCVGVSVHLQVGVAEAATLHVFVENRMKTPLEDCCLLLVPFSYGSDAMPEGLLWSGALTAELGAPIPPASYVRAHHRLNKGAPGGPLGSPSNSRGPMGPPKGGPQGGPPCEANASVTKEKEDDSLIERMRRKGAVLCHSLSLLPAAPGVYSVAAWVLSRAQHAVYWHHQPLRLVV